MRLDLGVRQATLRAGQGVHVAAALAAAAVTTAGDVGPATLAGPAPVLPDGAAAALGTDDTGGRDLVPVVGEPPPVPAEPGGRTGERPTPAGPGGPTPRPAKVPVGGPDPTAPVPDPDTLLVAFAEGTSDAAVERSLAAAGVDGDRIDGTTTVAVRTGDADHAALTSTLSADPAVALVEPNLVRTAAKVPNDPQRPVQMPWLETVGVPNAWDAANMGSAATVAVLDTGVDLDHPDLRPNLVAGTDVVNADSQPMDDNGHGTAVAGIIGAATQNGVGVAGVAWNARIMPVKVLDAAGNGNDALIAQGIRFATNAGADIINMSLGGSGSSETLRSAVQYAVDRNVLVVAATGNDGVGAPDYPSAYPQDAVLAVTATDAAGQFAAFSNYGAEVDLAAPGIDIRTTGLLPGAAVGITDGSGTSFASPIVAGVAALLVERHPTWNARTLADQLTRTARDRGPAGIDIAYGFGIVNAAAALGIAPAGVVSQPPLAGDAGNLAPAARSIAVGTTVSETLGYELDDDWFTFTVPAGGATVTVDPPAADPEGDRAAEADIFAEVHGPGGGRIAIADDGFTGDTEVLRFNAAAGTHRLRVTNYFASAGPAPYTVRVDAGLPPFATLAPRTVVHGPGNGAPGAPAIVDISGDGLADTVTVAGPALEVLTSVPGGAPPTRLSLTLHGTAAQQPRRPVVADLDGDGDLDVAVPRSTGLDVAWHDGTTLTAPVALAGADATSLVGAAQIDGTGPVEVVRASRTGTDLSLLRWNGTGFTVTPLFSRPAGSDVALGDVTGDGRVDIVTFTSSWAPTSNASVAVRTQGTPGVWTIAQQIPMADYADGFVAHATGDVSGDGRTDLVLVSAGRGGALAMPPLMASFLPDPDAAGRLVPFVLAVDAAPAAVAVGDVTGDDRSDVLVAHDGGGGTSPSLAVYRQTDLGRPTFAPAVYPLETGSPLGLGVGDVTGDGRGDASVAQTTGLAVLRQQVTATPTAEGPGIVVGAAGVAPHATGVAPDVAPSLDFGRDVDVASVQWGVTAWLHDGRTDELVPADVEVTNRSLVIDPTLPLTAGAPYQLVLYGIEDTAGNTLFGWFPFTVAPAAAAPAFVVNGTYSPVRLDIDANGYDDAIWYTGTTTLDPLWRFGPDGKTEGAPLDVRGTFVPVAGDFDGNGYQDVLWYAPGAGADQMWFYGPPPAAGGALTVTKRMYSIGGTSVPVAGDFDRNGFDDIFWYGPGTVAESVWRFGASGHTAVAAPAVNGNGYRLAAGDFNRDGYDDIFWHLPGGGAEALWRGGPSATFSRLATANVNGTYNLRAGDFTGDGFDDLYWWAGGSASLWRGGAAADFPSQAGSVVIPATARPVTGDFTGDGYDDLLAYVPGTAPDTLRRGTPTGLG